MLQTNFFALLVFLVMKAATQAAYVKCSNMQTCTFQFQLEDRQLHQVELIRETHSVFSGNAKVIVSGQEPSYISERKTFGVRFHSKPDNLWATALISHDGMELIEGVFQIKDQGLVEFKKKQDGTGEYHRRRMEARENFKDIILETPAGDKQREKWMQELEARKKRQQERKARNLDVVLANYPMNQYIKFFPNCFPNDAFPHEFHLSVILDYGVFYDTTSSISGSLDEKKNAMLSSFESLFSIGKLIFFTQMNIRFVVDSVTIGQPTDPAPLSGAQIFGTCSSALNVLPELVNWATSTNQPNTGYTLLLSNCFAGVDGVSYVGTACGTNLNAGVSAWDSYYVMLHEIGHGFGMSHSFENGVGTTGGIMDYGDGMLNGLVQYNPDKLNQACSFYTMLSNTNCPFFTISSLASNCGDGMLSENEQCECIQPGTVSCGSCRNCTLTDPSIECSSSEFVVRTSATPAVEIVNSNALQDPHCCVKNKFAPPKTLCGAGLLNACSAGGACTPICSSLLLPNNPVCGFDSAGCKLGCIWEGQCQFDLAYTLSGQQRYISALPDGSSCQLSKDQVGICKNGDCQETSSPTMYHSPVPTLTPSSSPTGNLCGNLILDEGEDCECLQAGDTACDQCVNCQLTSARIECSAKTFIVRSPVVTSGTPASLSTLSNPSCCVNNRFAPAKTLCNNNIDACGPYGKCSQICSAFLLLNNPNCGFDSTGCLLGCVWNGQCSFDMFYIDPLNQEKLISALPDGSACVSGGLPGACSNAKCIVNQQNSEGAVLSHLPTVSPTSASIPSTSTQAPSMLLQSPNCDPFDKSKCSKQSGCAFCHGKCQAITACKKPTTRKRKRGLFSSPSV